MPENRDDVPVMLGFMHDESSNALRTSKTVDEYKAVARRTYGERADAFLALYPSFLRRRCQSGGREGGARGGYGDNHAVARRSRKPKPESLQFF